MIDSKEGRFNTDTLNTIIVGGRTFGIRSEGFGIRRMHLAVFSHPVVR